MGKKSEERARCVKGRRIVLQGLQRMGQERSLGRLARALGKSGVQAPSCNHSKVCTWVGGYWDLIWTVP